MTHFLLLVLVLLVAASYFMTPDERARALRVIVAAVRRGIIGGIAVARVVGEVAREVSERVPHIRRVATATAAIVAVAGLYYAVIGRAPVTEAFDVRPEIERVIAVEARTSRLYDEETDRFRKGRINAAALADVIEKTIVPELRVAAGRLRALKDVPQEHQPLLATAETFLKLRDESWRLRAAALHKSDLQGLQRADSKEQASRETFNRLRQPSS